MKTLSETNEAFECRYRALVRETDLRVSAGVACDRCGSEMFLAGPASTLGLAGQPPRISQPVRCRACSHAGVLHGCAA